MNLILTGPKNDCLVPWYRIGSLLSIDTKIMKISRRMTSQWRFQTWPHSKSGFSVKIDQKWKKKLFFARKVPNIGILPGCFAYAAINEHLELPLLKDRQRFDAVSTSNLEVLKFRDLWILTYFIFGHDESSLNNFWSMVNLERTWVLFFFIIFFVWKRILT